MNYSHLEFCFNIISTVLLRAQIDEQKHQYFTICRASYQKIVNHICIKTLGPKTEKKKLAMASSPRLPWFCVTKLSAKSSFMLGLEALRCTTKRLGCMELAGRVVAVACEVRIGLGCTR